MGKKATNRSKQRNVEEEKKFNFDVKKISQSTKMGAVGYDVYAQMKIFKI